MKQKDNYQQKLIKALMSQEAYPHKIDTIKLIETHISLIFLTGKYAYKLKKSVDLEHIKMTTYELRNQCCEEEIKLNSRLSPELYLGVVIILGPVEKARIVSNIAKKIHSHKIIDSAVKMIQFPQKQLFSFELEKRKLDKASINKLATKLASFHFTVEQAGNNYKLKTLEEINNPIISNLKILMKYKHTKSNLKWLKVYFNWTKDYQNKFGKELLERQSSGVIRECHGDLHTGNIRLMQNNTFQIFDSIDFNKDLRTIDPISEIAFLIVDLICKNQKETSATLLNKWLEETGDYVGTRFLQWYLVYRALVRAKVATLTVEQKKHLSNGLTPRQSIKIKNDLDVYIKTAKEIQSIPLKGIIIMHGRSGSGKTFISEILYRKLFGIRIQSDIERKRAFGRLNLQEKYGHEKARFSKTNKFTLFTGDPYREEVTTWLYQEWVPYLTKGCLDSGLITIIDAAFLRRKERRIILDIAKVRNVPNVIVTCECSELTAQRRISKRLKDIDNQSEADFKIREQQIIFQEPLTNEEKKIEVKIDEVTNIDSSIITIKSLLKVK